MTESDLKKHVAVDFYWQAESEWETESEMLAVESAMEKLQTYRFQSSLSKKSESPGVLGQLLPGIGN